MDDMRCAECGGALPDVGRKGYVGAFVVDGRVEHGLRLFCSTEHWDSWTKRNAAEVAAIQRQG